MTTAAPTTTTGSTEGTKRFGYFVAVVVNLVLLWVVQNILTWDVAPFLTDDFEILIPITSVSLLFGAAINLAYVWFDTAWFKALTQMISAGIAMAVAIRTYQVFPFDFSAYDFGWAGLTRIVLIVAIAGTAIAIVVEFIKLARALAKA